MKCNPKEIENLLNGDFGKTQMIWELFKSNNLLSLGIVLGIISAIVLVVIFCFSLSDHSSTAPSLLVLALMFACLDVFLILGVKDSSKYIPYLELEEVKSEYKEKRYQLTFSTKIKDVNLVKNGNVEVKNSDGLTILVERDKVTSKDVGKKIILQRTGYENDEISIHFSQDNKTEVSVE